MVRCSGTRKACGSEQELLDEVDMFVQALIQFFIEHGGRDVAVSWGEVDQKKITMINEDRSHTKARLVLLRPPHVTATPEGTKGFIM
jgi:hypothetical protein